MTVGMPFEARRPKSGHLVVARGALLVAAAVLVAVGLRLADLAWFPLDQVEAAIALRAAGLFPDLANVGAGPAAPLLVQLDRLVFWLFGTGDGMARLAPALAGIAAVGATGLLGPVIGRAPAVVAAVAMALSPAWTVVGRHGSGGTVAAFAVVLFLAALGRTGTARATLLVVAGALLLAAGPAALTFIVAGIVVIAVLGRDVQSWLEETWPERSDRTAAAVAIAVGAALAATGLLSDLEGFQGLVLTPAEWFERLGGGGSGAQMYLLALVGYAPTELLFGTAGIVYALRRGHPAGPLLGLWAALGGLAGLLSGNPLALGELLLPLTLGLGIAIAALLESLVAARWSEEGVMAGILAVVLGFGLLQGFRVADASLDATGVVPAAPLQLLMGAGLMLIVLSGLYVFLWGRSTAARAIGVAALGATFVMGWSNAAKAAYSSAIYLREPLRPTYIPLDVRTLAAVLEEHSWAVETDPAAMTVRADPTLAPSLAWSLRNFAASIQWAEPRGELDARAVLRPAQTDGGAEEDSAFGPAPYLGVSYYVSARWEPGFGFDTTGAPTGVAGRVRNLTRWYLQRRPVTGKLSSGIDFEAAEVFLRVE